MKFNTKNTYYIDLLQRKKELIIDSNLLLLYIVGNFDINKIIKKSFPRTEHFDVDEFRILSSIIKNSKNIIVTPNILTEVCNHSKKLRQYSYYQLFEKLYKDFEEKLILSSEAFNFEEVYNFGITDSIIIALVEKYKYLLVTRDAPLANHLISKGIDVIKWIDIKIPLLK